MTSNTALDQVLENAQAAAASYQPPALTTGNAVAAPANNNTPARRTLADVAESGGLNVDEYLLAKTEGLKIGKDMKGLLDEIDAEIDLSDVAVIFSSRHELNGVTKFLKSYDGGLSTPDGQNFRATVAHYEAQGYKTSVYETAEIPLELLNDVADPKNASSVFPAGTMIGLTPSVTGFKSFQKFIKMLSKKDPSLVHGIVRVKLKHEQRKNAAGNEWGVVNFELID